MWYSIACVTNTAHIGACGKKCATHRLMWEKRDSSNSNGTHITVSLEDVEICYILPVMFQVFPKVKGR